MACKRDEILNPTTNRCVKKSGAIGKKILAQRRKRSRSCGRGQIRNPQTNRCVNKSGAIGKRILAQRARSRSRQRQTSRKCRRDEILNPRTNRCVKKSGAIGKQILAQRRRSRSRKRSQLIGDENAPVLSRIHLRNRRDRGNITEKVIKKFGAIVPPGYYVSKEIGKGAFGVAYLLCNRNQNACDRVMKVQRIEDQKEFNNEIAMQRKFATAKIAPKVHDVQQIRKGGRQYGVIVMDKIDGIMENLLEIEQDEESMNVIISYVIQFIHEMCRLNLTHGDFHWGNFGYIINIENNQFTVKPQLIDFGWSSAMPCRPDLELANLLRMTPNIENRKNKKFIRDSLYNLYRNNYNPNLKNNTQAFDREHDRLHTLYEPRWEDYISR
jgi:hypothetical protein